MSKTDIQPGNRIIVTNTVRAPRFAAPGETGEVERATEDRLGRIIYLCCMDIDSQFVHIPEGSLELLEDDK